MEENKPIHNEEGKSPPSTDDSQQQEPQLKTSSTDETIAPAAETTPEVEPPSPLNPQPSTIENMEVHHHAHDPAAPHHKKNWKSYFWEFLMLFLAVFCGFLAEYQLEHTIEHQREKQYIKSMVDDLKTDSIRIARIIDLNKQQVSGFDSLLQSVYRKPITDSSMRGLYYFHRKYSTQLNKMLFSKTTILQLKNSGGFRLIRNRAATDSIIRYDVVSEYAEGQGEGVDYSGKLLFELSVKLFDSEYLLDYNSTNVREILNSNKKFTLLTNDERIIKEYANLAVFKKDVIKFYIVQLTNLQNRIPGIIQFLEKEYHLN
ncbi:MAG: hypothetical protein K2Q24_06135 [Chitinophagaceae bacterium]|nr:hypothetical protein [Chitinophagaceae bacterium]